MDDAPETLRREIASDLLHAIHFSLARNAALEDLANSKIVRLLADLELERRRRVAEQPKESERSPRLRLMRKAFGR